MAWSPAPQAEAILAAAEGVGVPLTLHIPRTPFHGNEVEKRNVLMRLAMVHAEPMVDWIFIQDADEYVVHAAPDIREIVAGIEQHAISYALEEYLDPFVDLAHDGGVARTLPLPSTWRVSLRAMYRALPEMQYVGTHHTLGGWIPADHLHSRRWEWLWGHSDNCEAYDLREHLIVRHENPRRTALRRQQSAAYYTTREELGIEDQNVQIPSR